jgi:hypothetical protein
MTLGPNDRLGEVEAAGFENGWKVAEVTVTGPAVVGPGIFNGDSARGLDE